MPKQFLNPPGLGAMEGPYSHGVRSGRTVTPAGQAPLHDDGTVFGPGDPAAQCRRVFADLKKTLDIAGATFADVVYVRAYLTDKVVLPVLRVIAAEIFGGNRPAFTPFTAIRVPAPLPVPACSVLVDPWIYAP